MISAMDEKGILIISPSARSILTLGVVSACVVFILRTMPRMRLPSTVMTSTLSWP